MREKTVQYVGKQAKECLYFPLVSKLPLNYTRSQLRPKELLSALLVRSKRPGGIIFFSGSLQGYCEQAHQRMGSLIYPQGVPPYLPRSEAGRSTVGVESIRKKASDISGAFLRFTDRPSSSMSPTSFLRRFVFLVSFYHPFLP